MINKELINESSIKGVWVGKIIDVAGKVRDTFECTNLVVDEGINEVLNRTFNGASNAGSEYIGIHSTNLSPSANWNYASIGTTITEVVAYDEAARPEWITNSATDKSVTNAGVAEFSVNAQSTVWGGFIVTNSTKQPTGSTGIMFAALNFASSKTVEAGEKIQIQYTISMSSV